SDNGQRFADVIGQEEFDGTKRLHHVRDGRVDTVIHLVPGSVVVDGPAAFPLCAAEEVPEESVQSLSQFRVFGPYVARDGWPPWPAKLQHVGRRFQTPPRHGADGWEVGT